MEPSSLITLGKPGIGLDPASFGVTVAPAVHAEPPATVASAWDAMRTENPRLFNGPILSFQRARWDRGRIIAVTTRDSYQRLTVQQADPSLVDPPVMQLSVTGVITAQDRLGDRFVLVGKRSDATRIYGSMWELGPSGGIDAPPMSIDALDGFDVFRQLVTEIEEEVGLVANPDPGPILGLTTDPHASACDVVMHLRLARPLEDIIAHTAPDAEHGWEYTATRWIPVPRFVEFVRTEPCIPPTVSLAPLVASLPG